MSLNDKTFNIARLRGQENYQFWALRIKAYLTKEGLNKAIEAPFTDNNEIKDKALAVIRLSIEDGPLLQVQNKNTALEAWNALADLYSPKGFNSSFLLLRELFNTTLSKSENSMEKYTTTIRRLYDDLKSKGVELPKQVIIA